MVASTRQREISRELDSYISSKRKGGWFGMFGKSETRDVVAHEEAPAPEPTAAALVDEPMNDVGAADEQVDEPSSQKRGWFSRMFGGGEEVPADAGAVSDAPAPDDDLREIARITLAFLRMTDDAALARIKSSPDFDKFKELLRRRQIIK